MPNVTRISTRVTAVAAALAAGVTLAPAASAQTDKGSVNLAGLFTDQVITGSLNLEGGVARLVDVRSITQAVDDLGRSLGSPRTVALRAGTGTKASLGDYACLPKGKGNRDFRQFSPVEIFQNDGKGKIQALFHTYRQDNARTVGAGHRQMSTQYEICGVGGVAPDGSRTRRAGVGITLANEATTYKIGQAWKSESTPANYTLDMAFKGAAKGVEIGGGISQTPSHKLLGSFSTPFEAPVDAYARNAANAWWQDACIGSWHGCRHIHGSKDFHGAVAHGLYEFTPGQADAAYHGFRFSAFRSAS